jgi:hypothetical protein
MAHIAWEQFSKYELTSNREKSRWFRTEMQKANNVHGARTKFRNPPPPPSINANNCIKLTSSLMQSA